MCHRRVEENVGVEESEIDIQTGSFGGVHIEGNNFRLDKGGIERNVLGSLR